MRHQESITRSPVVAGTSGLWLLGAVGAVTLVLAGCSLPTLSRGQADDESEVNRYDIATIGERTTVANAEPVSLGGVGLITDLEGTGGDCNADGYRTMLANELRRDRNENANVNEVLRSPNNALVIVEAAMQPGAAKGDRIDVEVKLPPGSKATSLRGGKLKMCYLFNYDFARNLRADYQGSQNMLLGHKLAQAEGPVLVSLGDGDEAARIKVGRIWGGAKLLKDNPLALSMNLDSQRAALTSLISDRINTTFQANIRDPMQAKIAYTGDKESVAIRVPAQYRLNMPRYLRVVRFIPLSDATNVAAKDTSDKRTYSQILAADLLDPTRTVLAAHRLEAMGQGSMASLEAGLKSPHALVRFCSAEALAYLGNPRCSVALAQAARSPLFRSYALAALASLDEAVCHLELRRLISEDGDPDLRYGAFRALRALNEQDDAVQGEHLNDSFWLHRVAPQSRPFVHISTTKRAEVVLYGETPQLKGPFSLLAGEFTITATKDDARVNISRVPLLREAARRQSSFELEDVLRGMADLGASYSEIIAMLQQANAADCLSCKICVDALPRVTDIQDLVKSGKEDADLLPAGQDLGKVPNLYRGLRGDKETR
jgi:flagellar basal body P-ring protein FlgI